MRKNAGLALVLGLGRFGGGQEAAKFLHRRGWHLRIADRARADDLADTTRTLSELHRVEWALGREDLDLLTGIDLVVVNPAVPQDHPLVQAARSRGIELSQEVNLFLEHYPGRVILVSGTNGKSTTSTLLSSVLSRGRSPVLLGGNIGNSLLDDEPRWQTRQRE